MATKNVTRKTTTRRRDRRKRFERGFLFYS